VAERSQRERQYSRCAVLSMTCGCTTFAMWPSLVSYDQYNANVGIMVESQGYNAHHREPDLQGGAGNLGVF